MVPHILFTMFSIPNTINKMSASGVPDWKVPSVDSMLVIMKADVELIFASQFHMAGGF